MLAFLRPYLALAVAFAIIAIAVVIWFSGVHRGGAYVQAKWDRQELAAAELIAGEQAKRIKEEQSYELQLRAATDQAVAHRAELDRLRAAPHPRLVCHAATAGSSSPVSSAPANPAARAPGDGLLPPAVRRDIANDLYLLADDADDAIETARNYQARVPH